MSKVAVVIPIYKEELDDLEKISLAQVRKVLKNYPIVFVAPANKNFSYIKPDEMLIQFHPYFFQSPRTYNKLLIHPFFYELFLNFDYILLYQLDAFVFYDALEDFCQLGYDYIGAAWSQYAWIGKKIEGKTPRVGNGGFSLRKVKACHELLKEVSVSSDYKKFYDHCDEDAFFAIYGVMKNIDFKVAPISVANLFAMEWHPDRHIKKLGGKLPFGCHGWTKFSADFYVELFARLGYDLHPFRNQMKNDDYELHYPLNLKKCALVRLIRQVNRGQSIFKYLPTKNFASVRVVESFGAMKIADGLLAEENSLIDKVFIHNEKNFKDLIRDLTRENLPHLIIAINHDDKSLISAIEDKGLTYGEHFILFQHEYMKFQEKFLHSLGVSKMEVKNPSVFEVGKPLPAQFSKYFIGQAYLNPLTDKGGAIANVTFSPGCRNNWHIHHKGGQILLVTGGRGWYQEWGKAPQALKPGDVVNIAPEVKHWHGAAADSWFSHLAVEIPAENSSNEWLEPVDDEQYSKLK